MPCPNRSNLARKASRCKVFFTGSLKEKLFATIWYDLLAFTAHIFLRIQPWKKRLSKNVQSISKNSQNPQNPDFHLQCLLPCSSLWAKSKISSALMLPSTKRLDAVVLCRAHGDSEWSDWPGEIATKKSPPFRCSPTPSHSERTIATLVQNKQEPHLSEAAYIFLVLQNPWIVSISQVAGCLFLYHKNKPNKFDNIQDLQTQNEIWKGCDAMQLWVPSLFFFQVSINEATWPGFDGACSWARLERSYNFWGRNPKVAPWKIVRGRFQSAMVAQIF